MAVRYGGRLELEGGLQSIVLPADGASDQRELAELRRELEQAQQLGEAYARELAAVFAAGSPPVERASIHPAEVATARFEMLRAMAASIVRLLREWLEALRVDAAHASEELGETAPVVQALQRRVTAAHELASELERIAACPTEEPTKTCDLIALARDAVASAETRAARHDVRLVVDAPERLEVKLPQAAVLLLLRSLLDHAIAATPRDATITLRLARAEGAVRLAVEDGGPAVPEDARDLLRYRVDPTSFGRPGGPALLVAEAVAAHLGCPLELGESSAGRTEVSGLLPV
jgi:signal transduction histidine kinase